MTDEETWSVAMAVGSTNGSVVGDDEIEKLTDSSLKR
jgi:hypothetical protein